MENQRDTKLKQSKGRRVLLFPLPLQGHISPMLQLANILHSQGFSITIIHTSFNSPNPSHYPQFTFHPISEGLSESEASMSDIISLLSLLNIKCVEPFRQALAQLLSQDVEDHPIACLISDAVLHFTRKVAERFKLPRLVLRTGGVCSFLVFAAFPLLMEKGYLPIQDARLEEPVVELPPLRVKDLPVAKTSNLETYYEIVQGLVQETKASAGLVWNSFEELEHDALAALRENFPIPIFPIGPFHRYCPAYSDSLIASDQSSMSWLDTQARDSVIYVSFGSIAALDEKFFLEIAWGLANSKYPFLWVVRPGSVCGSEWLEPLPDGFLAMLGGRGLIVKWAPQQAVLAHLAVGAFWTHNGWNSTLESICEGVPMICMPCFTDQMVNARYVSDVWQLGLQLQDGLQREKIESGIRSLMEEKEGEEIRKRVLHMKEKASVCVRPGGSSCESLEKLRSYIFSF